MNVKPIGKQLSLFSGSELLSVPTARATDPQSSLAAARRHLASGRSESNAATVLAAVRRWPGSTSRELSERIPLERHEVARRLSGLERAGHVRKGDHRICAISKTTALSWWAL